MRRFYRFEGIPFDRAAILSGLVLLLKDKTLGRTWLVLDGNRPIGYVILAFSFDLEFGGRVMGLTDLYLESGYRGKGVGRKVLRHIERFCRTCGVRAVELQVRGDNARALAFYERFGFAAHGRIPMSKRLG